LSNPDDVRAIVPDGSQSSNVLIHFGTDKFLDRYRQYQQHLAEWRSQCPRLASVDMRYDQQVVLDPCPPVADAGTVPAATNAGTQASAPKAANPRGTAVPVRVRSVAPRKNTIKVRRKPAHGRLHGTAQ
jgi:cell division protein FtsQ